MLAVLTCFVSCALSQKDHVSVRLPFKYPGGASSDKPSCLVSDGELRALRSQQLLCRFCRCPVTLADNIRKAVMLPSPCVSFPPPPWAVRVTYSGAHTGLERVQVLGGAVRLLGVPPE